MLLHVHNHSRTTPNKPAYKMVPDGETVTFSELESRSNQCAHLLRACGLKRGDVIAILLENHPRYFEIALGAERSGIYFTGISTHLSAKEAGYIVGDSDARVLFASMKTLPAAREIVAENPDLTVFIVDGTNAHFRDYLAERAEQSTSPIPDGSMGAPMLYSSGTTGRPKGVKFELPEIPIDAMDSLTELAVTRFGFNSQMVYLSPAPLYHAAPLRWSLSVMKLGGTVIVMDKFDAEYALQLIEQERVTHSQWVPTHFIRMLKLPEGDRSRYDLSSHELAFHAAAPCPVPVKEQMISWWGPMIHEYYAGTEFNGMTIITPEEWLQHKGSVGQAKFGTAHILSDDGKELPARKEGMIFFEGGNRFSYHKDAEKTASSYNSRGWSTLGDIGWLDEDGYLYLTDRKSFMIISGGVNIYPQEIEDVIVTHPEVADVAVIGAPDPDLGERLVAVIQPLDMSDAGERLSQDIQEHVLSHLGRLKLPRQIDYMAELPRLPTGKLYKRVLRDAYWKEEKIA
ncbi:long-chain-fatty-acid--CoA ligase [Hyphomonas adhaerens MHS-3]|uniref:Long-chain-fatty-acid--CoA ligase n=1 Tax=Hyphomonas adhaerens MHS-3 TaxID=1280949 RepID=A0A069E820_9PROT|nr:acyl-CoA synthetase [Hyphomonas adhaerens]KCZ86129.1 long-chain-fatty-acid--CoA ligase [Hyphomonas adhaerens MHS-3]